MFWLRRSNWTKTITIARLPRMCSESQHRRYIADGSLKGLLTSHQFMFTREGFEMATANETVKKVLNNLNQRISSVGGVVDKWSDGQGNWWRKYSDGFLVQGYKYSGDPSTNKNISISFPTSFSDANYKVLCETTITGWAKGLNTDVISGTRTTVGCTLYISTYEYHDTVNGLSFVAFGY